MLCLKNKQESFSKKLKNTVFYKLKIILNKLFKKLTPRSFIAKKKKI